MILNDPKYCPIIKVYFNKFVNKIFKGNSYYSGKNSRSILKCKRHDCILQTPPLHRKGGLVSIFLCNSNMMVTRETISEWINFLTPDTFQYLICKWSQKWVMQIGIIQFSQVDTNAYFKRSIFVLYYYRDDPFWFFSIWSLMSPNTIQSSD